jgi:phage repressor protein C with HTH and peptisase S24 domain
MLDKSMNLTEFSEAIGLSLRTFQRYYSGERGIPSKTLEELTVRMGVSASWLLTGRGTPYLVDDSPNGHAESAEASDDFVQIQRFAVSASAGHGAHIDEDELGTGWYAFNKKWLDKRSLKPNNLSVISVRGDSMEPKFSDKDLVLLDHSQNLPEDGFIYAINYDNALYIKAIQRAPHDTLNLVSENKSYPPISVNLAKDADSLRVVGRVVASMHEW